MANWTTIDETAVQTGKFAALLAAVRRAATAASVADPLPEFIADVVAQLRRAVAVGNQVDVDPTKIPNSLKGLAIRMVVRLLKDYVQVALSEDEKAQRAADLSELNRIIDKGLKFETPDDPAEGAGEIQRTQGNWNSQNRIVGRTEPVPRPGVQGGTDPGRYSNPTGPEDNA